MITKKPNKKIIIIVVLVLVLLLLSSIASVLTSFFWSNKKKPKSKPVDGPGNGAVVVPPGGGDGDESGDGVGSGYVFSDNDDGPIIGPLIPGEPECQVHLYKDTGFRGKLAVLKNGEYDHEDLKKIPNMVDVTHGLHRYPGSHISSVYITGDNRCKVQLTSQWGQAHILNRSDKYPFISDLMTIPIYRYGTYNDNVTKLKIWAPLADDETDLRDAKDNELCELTLFDGTGNNKYSGSTFYRSITKSTGGELFDLDIENNFDDNTDAVYLRGKGCVLDMSENTGYSGGTSRVTVPQGKSDIMFRLDKNDPIEGFIYNGSVRENQMGSYKVGTVTSPPVNTNPTNTTNTTSRKLHRYAECTSNSQCQSNDCRKASVRGRVKKCT